MYSRFHRILHRLWQGLTLGLVFVQGQVSSQPLRDTPNNHVLSPLAAAKAQLEAYNKRDLAAFVAVFADDVRVYREPKREPVIVGKLAFTEVYRQRFQTPGLRAEILNRIELGNKVIEHERVYGISEQPTDIAVIYEVIDGKIQNVWFFRAEPSAN